MNTDYTNEPICPHCGEANGDAWELRLGDGECTDTDCDHCSEPMTVSAHIEITYSTEMTPNA